MFVRAAHSTPSEENNVYKVIWQTKLNGAIGRDAADDHWRQVHADLMRQLPGVIKYVQNLWVAPLDPAIGGPDRFDLHSECWFADEETYRAAMETPEWAAVAADSPKCFDNSELIGAVLEERVIIDRSADVPVARSPA
jgi:uncharacterized protein (TIGR02118 family)